MKSAVSTTNFFVPSDLVRGDRVTFPPEEALHASRVLRAAAGKELAAVDGEGGWYRIVLDNVDRDSVAGQVVERRREVGEPAYDLTVAMGLVKNRGRFETFLEKAVEIGVSQIVPLITERTERERIRYERSGKVLIAAMKQCGRSRLVKLRDARTLDEYLSSPDMDAGYCCHETAGAEDRLLDVLRADARPARLAALVGPEGGFSKGEVGMAREAGFRVVRLGPRRLRSETAAILVAAAISLVYDCACE